MTQRSISGYTTTYNCLEMEYPFEECIRSLLGFCEEVVVVDAGSNDGTIEALQRLSAQESRVRYYVEPVDFSHSRWAIYQDGYLKAKARAHCKAEYCWQTDTDEIVPPEEFGRIRMLPEIMKGVPLIMLPMVEFWGSLDRVRGDFLSWKPRFSVNDPRITHGIPAELICRDANGHEYPRPFDSDTCNYIYRDTKESVRIVVPIPPERGDIDRMTTSQWQKAYFKNLEDFPHVLHLSWLDLPRKIRHYKKHWVPFHSSMYNLMAEDVAQNNVMFDKPWSEVTDSDIERLADELKRTGPRFFHRKCNAPPRGITFPFARPIPVELRRWLARRDSPSTETEIVATEIDMYAPPSYSFIVAAHNDAAALEATLQSILRQEYHDVETIVVFQGKSLDAGHRAVEYIPRMKLRFIEKPVTTVADAWNAGIRVAEGAYVIPLEYGDTVTPDLLRTASEFLKPGGSQAFVSRTICATAPNSFWEMQERDPYLLRYQESIPPRGIVAKELWDISGGFSVSMESGAEWEFWLRANVHGLTVAAAEETHFTIGAPAALRLLDPRRRELANMWLKVLDSNLYPVEEVLEAAKGLGALYAPRLKEIDTWCLWYRGEWVLRFIRGAAHEIAGRADQALSSYIESIQMSSEKRWLPVYKAGEMVSIMGLKTEARDFFYTARMLRPDLTSLVQQYFEDVPVSSGSSTLMPADKNS